MTRKQWFNLHHWAGFQLSLLLVFVLMTGTLATISKELDWLTNKAIRANSAISNDQKLPWPDLMASVTAAFPNSTLLSIQRPEPAWHNVAAIARNPEGERFFIYLDAVTAQVQGTGKWYNWQRFLREIHRHLMLPISVGVSIVGLCAFIILFMLVTGLNAYKNWWKQFFKFKRVKPLNLEILRSRPKAVMFNKLHFWGELHKLVGLWSLWFMLLVGLTGTWYVVEQWGGRVRYPALYDSQELTSTASYSKEAVTQAITTVRQINKDLQVNELSFSKASPYLIEVDGQDTAWFVRDRANRILFDSQGSYLGERNGEHLNWHFRISEAADPIHMGRFAGWKSRYIWFVFGVMLTGLCVSGVYMYALRLIQNTSLQSNYRGARLAQLWGQFTWLRWPILILIMVCLGLTVQQLIFY